MEERTSEKQYSHLYVCYFSLKASVLFLTPGAPQNCPKLLLQVCIRTFQAVTCLQVGRTLFPLFPNWPWQEERKQVIRPHYFQNRAKGNEISMEKGPRDFPQVSWAFLDHCDLLDLTWKWLKSQQPGGLKQVWIAMQEFSLWAARTEESSRSSSPSVSPYGRNPDGKLPWQQDHAASRWLFLAGPALTQRISSGFSDLGNITRVAFSHGWIVPEQFLWCIRHKHGFCQHQACLISPPAFSPSSTFGICCMENASSLCLFHSKFPVQAEGAITPQRKVPAGLDSLLSLRQLLPGALIYIN